MLNSWSTSNDIGDLFKRLPLNALNVERFDNGAIQVNLTPNQIILEEPTSQLRADLERSFRRSAAGTNWSSQVYVSKLGSQSESIFKYVCRTTNQSTSLFKLKLDEKLMDRQIKAMKQQLIALNEDNLKLAIKKFDFL